MGSITDKEQQSLSLSFIQVICKLRHAYATHRNHTIQPCKSHSIPQSSPQLTGDIPSRTVLLSCPRSSNATPGKSNRVSLVRLFLQ